MPYEADQAQRDLTAPTVAIAEFSKRWLDRVPRCYRSPTVRPVAAAYETAAPAVPCPDNDRLILLLEAVPKALQRGQGHMSIPPLTGSVAPVI
jgi:hypothetical protein